MAINSKTLQFVLSSVATCHSIAFEQYTPKWFLFLNAIVKVSLKLVKYNASSLCRLVRTLLWLIEEAADEIVSLTFA